MSKSKSGFTIVELLIVIVVIAILAAISVVAYTGIQQRATNAAIISTASQTIKGIQAYIAANSAYPLTPSTNTVGCIVAPTPSSPAGNCRLASGAIGPNTTFNNNLATISNLSSSPPAVASSGRGGVYFTYYPSRTYNSSPQPLAISYELRGDAQPCNLANVADITGGLNMTSSTTGYTTTSAGYTECIISIAGP